MEINNAPFSRLICFQQNRIADANRIDSHKKGAYAFAGGLRRDRKNTKRERGKINHRGLREGGGPGVSPEWH